MPKGHNMSARSTGFLQVWINAPMVREWREVGLTPTKQDIRK